VQEGRNARPGSARIKPGCRHAVEEAAEGMCLFCGTDQLFEVTHHLCERFRLS